MSEADSRFSTSLAHRFIALPFFMHHVAGFAIFPP
jgi:hypothetical protein